MSKHHSKFESEKYYHVYNRGNNKEDLFRSSDNYHYFLQKWKTYISPHTSTLAYCLMPNHFHFLVQIPAINDGGTNLTKPLRLGKVVMKG